MPDYSKMLEVMSTTIIQAAKRLIDGANFDRSSVGKIVSIDGHNYTVNAFGGEYVVYSPLFFAVNESVVVTAPQNNFSKLLLSSTNHNDEDRVLQRCYPIGSVYISTVYSSPAQLFGGTWELLRDRFLLGAGDTYGIGDTGGESAHTLTSHEMPSHQHNAQSHWIDYAQMGGSGNNRMVYCVGGGSTPVNGTFTTSTGDGWAHNNMPPYIVVYMWKRTA